jgi:4-amino-4-deoxy-L-arabinose transferase-like glycosyltransferase
MTAAWGRSPRAALVAVVLICIAIRVAVVFWMPRDYGLLPRDPDMYGHLASRIAAGQTYSLPGRETQTAMRPPLYPIVLAPLWAAGLGGTPAPLLLYAVIDSLTCLALYALARRLGGSLVAALLAALCWALYLPQAAMETRLWTEPLAALLATSALWALTTAARGGGLRRFILGGALVGLGSLAHSTLLFVGLAAAIAASMTSTDRMKTRLGRLVTTLLACALVMTPWAVRNAVALDAFVPTTTHGGQTVWEGNCGLADEDFLRNIHIPEARERFDRILSERKGVAFGELSEVERDRAFRAETLRIIREHPGRYALLSLNRFARLWFNLGFKGEPPSGMSIALSVLHGALLALFIAGLAGRRRRRLRPFAPALTMVIVSTILYMATIAYARYAFPMVPAVLAMTAAAWMGGEGMDGIHR